MTELIELPQYDLSGNRIPDTAVLWWHNTTKAEQDNIRLKMQIEVLIKSTSAISDLAADLKPVTKFFSEVPETPKKKLTKAQRIAAIIEEQERKLNQDSINRIKQRG